MDEQDALKRELLCTKETLLNDSQIFTQYFYKHRTGRNFVIAEPKSRKAHQYLIWNILEKVESLEIANLNINTPGRSGKTEIICHWIARMLAKYPQANFLYISATFNLATDATMIIRDIVRLPIYRYLFGVELREDSQAKNKIRTKQGGSVEALGAGGTITGKGAGVMGAPGFGGSIIIDDIMEPDDALSDVIRPRINNWYFTSIYDRYNSSQPSRIYIGHRLHEDDLPGNLIESGDWQSLIIPALDSEASNSSFFPEKITTEELMKIKELSPFTFAAKYQQDPISAGATLFTANDFPLFDVDPEMIATFVTADTAETDKTVNDATVFSFWGLYKIVNHYIETDLYGIHWIDCRELRVAPKDLQDEFWQFYATCMRYKTKPKFAAIEKKSTGVTLLSVLKEMQGLIVVDIDRNISSGCKNARFKGIQQYIASRLVSLPKGAPHTSMCINHMTRITANGAQAHDDIADTCYDAIKLALVDKFLGGATVTKSSRTNETVNKILKSQIHYNQQRRKILW